jgi:hypothetical protein
VQLSQGPHFLRHVVSPLRDNDLTHDDGVIDTIGPAEDRDSVWLPRSKMRPPSGSIRLLGTFIAIVASAKCRSALVVSVINRALSVLLKMTKRPFSANVGASRCRSFPRSQS